MDFKVVKEAPFDSVFVEILCKGIISTFVGVENVYIGSRAGDYVCICFCSCRDHVGFINLFADDAEVLIAESKSAGVFREENPFELGAA